MRTSKRSPFFPVWLAFAVGTSAVPQWARAQAEDQAAARALFDEGRRLAGSKNYDAACPKFEAARKLYISAGVLLNLADCYEKIGRTASAWTTFGEAASVANRTKRTDDDAEAKRRQAILEPRLAHLSVHVIHEEPGLTVKRDGIEVPTAALNEAIPVDPGPHEIRAEAPGYGTWSTSVILSPQDLAKTVEVPELRPAQGPQVAPTNDLKPAVVSSQASPSEPAAAGSPGAGQHIVGLVAGGAGVVTLAVGGILGLVAKEQDSSAQSEAGNARHTDSLSAAHLGDGATVVAVMGGVATAAGVVIWLTAPRGSEIGTDGREILLRGTF